MWLIFTVLVFLVLFVNIKKTDFDSLFVSISFFYMTVFFIYPLYIVEGNPNVTYLGSAIGVNDEGILKAGLSFAVFVFGFFFLSLFKRISLAGAVREKSAGGAILERPEMDRQKASAFFWIVSVVVILYLLSEILDSGRAERGYLIRQGVEKGNWFTYLSSIVFGALSMSVFFVAVASKKYSVVLLLSLLMVLSLLTGATGRASVLVFMTVLFIYYFRLKASYVIFLFFLVFPLVIPILVNMKEIISGISLRRELPDLLSYYESTVTHDLIMANFGHPLASIVFVDKLIELVGYRYFYDYLQGLLFYLRAFGANMGDSLTYYNTEVFLGVRNSVIPTGYVAFGFVQLSYLGVFISGMFYRLIGYAAGFVFRVYGAADSDMVKFYFANSAAYTFYIGEVRTLVITFLVPMFVVYFSSKYMLRKPELS